MRKEIDRMDILTVSGFQVPKGEAVSSLKKAENLYAYHKEHDEEVLYKYYKALSKKEIDKFIDLFIGDAEDIDERLDLALHLVLFSYACGDKLPRRFYDYLLEQQVYYYGELYLRAEEAVAEKLIAVLEDGNVKDQSVNHLLCALSAIPCETTKEFLHKSSEKPLPKWAKKLHILPMEYSKVSGWQTENGQIERLYADEITAFERCKKEKASPLSPVKALEENCGYCGQPLTLVFDGAKKLATCMYCSCYETVFVKQEGDKVYWHLKNTPTSFLKDKPEYMKNDKEITERFAYAVRPTKEKRKPTYTAHQFVNIPNTQIGGMPTAVNDVQYPLCPDCEKAMHFVAQFDIEMVEDCGEGLYYFFTCENCGVHGTNYDQT